MKKSVLIALFGAASVAATYGQGYVLFSNYYASLQTTGITYANGPSQGLGVGSAISVELFYGASSDTLTSQLTGISGSIVAVGYNGVTTPTALPPVGPYAGAGVFVGNGDTTVLIPGTPGSTYAFAIYAFGTGAPGVGGNGIYNGWSPIVQGVTQGSTLPLGTVPALPTALSQGSFTVSEVISVPEPSSLALAGLGGFGMLMAFRRKKA
jgi:hypothetical protein